MKRRNLDFTNLAAGEQTVVDLISVGKLYLNPAAIVTHEAFGSVATRSAHFFILMHAERIPTWLVA